MGKNQHSKRRRKARPAIGGLHKARRNNASVPVEGRYVRFGSQRPPKDELIFLKESMQAMRKPRHGVLLADVCLDLCVVDPRQYDRHLSEARDALDNTMKNARALLASSEVRATRVLPVAAMAILKYAELTKWEAVLGGDQPRNNYYPMLMAADSALRLQHDKRKNTHVAELLPVLLGQRAMARGKTGWHGRLALTREDKGSNPLRNWDAGIVFTKRGADYINPCLRLQIKNGAEKVSMDESVTLISNAAHGIADTRAVISGCMAEINPALCASVSGLLTTDKLDNATESLQEAFKI